LAEVVWNALGSGDQVRAEDVAGEIDVAGGIDCEPARAYSRQMS
jgi:hypothetical protein